MDPRLEEINNLLIRYSLGEFDQKIPPYGVLDEIDAFITNINMLGEELKVSTISRDYFNNIFHSVSDMLFVLDKNGNISSINSAVSDKLNYPDSRLKGISINFLLGGKSDFFVSLVQKMQTESIVHSNIQFCSANNTWVPVNCSCSYLYNQGKEIIGYLLIARDLSKIKQYERALIESERRYRSIFESTSDCLFILDEETRFKEINEAGIRLFKYSKEELRKKKIRELIFNQERRNLIRHELDTKGSVVDFEIAFVDSQNNIIKCLTSANTIYNEEGKLIGWHGIIKDISEQKKTENLVIKAIVDTQEKERTRIARDIHDSLQQKVTGVRSYLGTLKALSGKVKSTDSKYSEIYTKSTDALNDILAELTNISFNLMPGTLRDFGLGHAIKELRYLVENEHNLEMEVLINTDFKIVDKTIEISLFRIIQEFINNAVEHGNASKISVNIRWDNEGKNILATLSDNGKGFKMKKFSTLSGMGLKNVNSRVESHNGNIKIMSAINKGTTYEIIIPWKNNNHR